MCVCVSELWFDDAVERVVSERAEMFGALVLSSRPAEAAPGAVADALLGAAIRSPRKALSFNRDVDRFLVRLRWLAAARPELALPTFEDWEPFLQGVVVGETSFAGLRKRDLLGELRTFIGYEGLRALERLAPKSWPIPSGSRVRITYGDPGAPPVLAARIQQLFGMRTSPEIAGVRVAVHLLAPNNRPQQITTDLENFWATTYAEVRRELRGRYPKHPWPEDPLTAEATERAKRRR